MEAYRVNCRANCGGSFSGPVLSKRKYHQNSDDDDDDDDGMMQLSWGPPRVICLLLLLRQKQKQTAAMRRPINSLATLHLRRRLCRSHYRKTFNPLPLSFSPCLMDARCHLPRPRPPRHVTTEMKENKIGLRRLRSVPSRPSRPTGSKTRSLSSRYNNWRFIQLVESITHLFTKLKNKQTKPSSSSSSVVTF